MTTIAITGATGFIGLHTILAARRAGHGVVPIDRLTLARDEELAVAIAEADALIHLAGQNRGRPAEIERTNVELAERLAAVTGEVRTPVIYASTTQRHLDNPYGRSKRRAEEILHAERGIDLTIAEIPNVFGPGCRPFYNSVVATFCHQLTHDEEPSVHENSALSLVWVVDLAEQLVQLAASDDRADHVVVGPRHDTTVAELLQVLRELAETHFGDHQAPALPTQLHGQLYRTLITYADPAEYAHEPRVFRDERGRLFECVKQWSEGGQVFLSTTKPGVERGNHYHTRKYEKFCVLAGSAEIRLRKMGSDDVLRYPVTGEEPTVVDIPLFHTHSIINTGEDELLTLFWANEVFDPGDADTFAERVEVAP